MMASSTLKTSEDILPYQFEPIRKSDDEDEWTDCSDEDSEEDSDVERLLDKEERNKVDVETWCKCGNCQQKPLAIECMCCTELDETKVLLVKKNIGIHIFKFLSPSPHAYFVFLLTIVHVIMVSSQPRSWLSI